MPGPAPAGLLIYAKDLNAVASFYQHVLNATLLHADHEHRVLQTTDMQIVIHAMPPPIADGMTISVPPEPRTEQAIKPFFSVEHLAAAEGVAEAFGGRVWGPIWPGVGFRVRNVCDPEGNIIHLRELTA